MAAQSFPPFELTADLDDLATLGRTLTHFAQQKTGAGTALWLTLKDRDDHRWDIGVTQQDLAWKFEVFSLAIRRQEGGGSEQLPWESWPLGDADVRVLRRQEFLIDGVEAATFGVDPSAQAASRPGQAPPEASKTCEVAVGVLFQDEQGRRALIAADWMPCNILFSDDPDLINEFLSDCEALSLEAYAELLGGSARPAATRPRSPL